MKRFLKRHLKPFLPTSLRAALKRQSATKFVGQTNAPIVLSETDGAIRCHVDDRYSFVAPLACKEDLNHFSTTAQGRSEFYSIARAANGCGILFDIGAHSGLISALFCAANPENTVFSFEPSPVLCKRLLEIRDLNGFGPRMKIEQVGIGDVTRTVEMLLDPLGGYIQSQRFDHTMWATPEVIEISIERIADAAARLDVIPQFIKLDVESYEYEAIHGSIDFLRRHKPVIFLEIHLDYLEQRKLSARSIVTALQECGYRFFAASGTQLRPSDLYDSPMQNIHIIAAHSGLSL